jgi:hypothetical protein
MVTLRVSLDLDNFYLISIDPDTIAANPDLLYYEVNFLFSYILDQINARNNKGHI